MVGLVEAWMKAKDRILHEREIFALHSLLCCRSRFIIWIFFLLRFLLLLLLLLLLDVERDFIMPARFTVRKEQDKVQRMIERAEFTDVLKATF